MHKSLTALSALLLIGSALILPGCTMQHTEPPDFTATVAIAGLTLAEECGGDERMDPGLVAGDCAPGATDCSLPCTQSNVMLTLDADADRALPFEVIRAVLIDSDGRELMELSTHSPQSYDGSSYSEWNESIPTPAEGMNVMYDLSGLDWSGVDDAWSATYRLQLTVEIDSRSFSATSTETARQAPIVT